MAPASGFPAVSGLVQAAGGRVDVFAVLHEDRYETTFGDGAYYYLWNVFDTKDAAELDVRRNIATRRDAYAQWGGYHHRAVSIATREAQLEVTVRGAERADAFSPEDLLRKLEDRHALGYLRTTLTVDWMVAWDATWLVSFHVVDNFYCYRDAAVDHLLASGREAVSIHAVAAIEGGDAGPGVGREEWFAGKRPSGRTAATPVPQARLW